ncbi:MAG: sel1 repeat family protein [Proteobacteria bacterium]|nr:sel1 repeat family protein [Pseudomonadota bacterium]
MTEFEKGKEAYDKGDYIIAFRILEPLAQQEDLEAMLILGFMFETGQQGIPQDYSEAFKWYQRSARGNDVRGLFNYGRMYYEGFHTPKDYREAEKLFIQATEKGHMEAYYYLGMIYERGVLDSRKENPVLAHMCYNLAASKGHEDAVITRDRVAKNLTADQINHAHELAWGLWEKENPKPKGNS